jgi:hypothetical protein
MSDWFRSYDFLRSLETLTPRREEDFNATERLFCCLPNETYCSEPNRAYMSTIFVYRANNTSFFRLLYFHHLLDQMTSADEEPSQTPNLWTRCGVLHTNVRV